MPQKFWFLKFKNEFFLFLLPLFFILHGLNEHFDAIAINDAFVLLLKYFAVAAVLTFVFGLVFKSVRKAAILSFFILLFFLFFGSLHDWLKNVFNNNFFSTYSFILCTALALFFLVFFYLKRSTGRFSRLTRFLNFLFLILIVFELTQLAYKSEERKTALPAGLTVRDTCDKRDIFLIISDTYSGKQELRDVFKFDNTPFEDSLKARGFHIVENSLSNYRSTIYSMSSMLNMNYVEGLKGTEDYKENNYLFSKINNSAVTKYLKQNGYEVENFSLFKLGDEFPALSNHIFPTGTGLITKHTLFARMEEDLGYHFETTFKIKTIVEELKRKKESELQKEKYRDRIIINKTIKKLNEKNPEPQFYYIHIYQPHGPSFFDKNGKEFTGKHTEEEMYIQSLQYTNKQVLHLVDKIMKTATRPPVILFMGDHGYRLGNSRYSYMTINSVFLPSKNYRHFYNGMTHVNQFRVLLNNLFKQNLPLLKDSIVRF